QEDGPAGTPRARREDFRSADEIAPLRRLHRGTESDPLTRDARLRLTAPSGPDITPFDDPLEPAILLPIVTQSMQQHLRVDLTLPAATESHVGFGQCLGHHPKCIESLVGPETEPAMRTRDGGCVKP